MSRTLDWLFPLLGYALAAAGAALLLWALFRDRARGRRRCPKCWYDMGGIPGLRCPECGHEARSEKRLARTRRHWRLACLGALVGIAGCIGAHVPEYRRGGWVGTLPTWALAIWAPAKAPLAPGSALLSGPAILSSGAVVPIQTRTPSRISPPGSVTIQPGGAVTLSGGSAIQTNPSAGGFLVLPGGSYTIGAAPTVTVPAGQAAAVTYSGAVTMSAWPPSAPLDVRLYREIWARLNTGKAWEWEAAIYMRRVLAATPAARPANIVRFPSRWPTDSPVPVLGVSIPSEFTLELRLPGGDWTAVRAPANSTIQSRHVVTLDNPRRVSGTPPVEARCRIAGKTVYSETLTPNLELRGTPADFLERVDSPESTQQVLAAMRPRLIRDGGRAALAFNDRDDSPLWNAIQYGVFFDIEVRDSGRTVARGSTFADWLRPVWKTDERMYLQLTGPLPDGPLELVLRGNAAAAGAYYCDRPFGVPGHACWTGELVIPLATLDDQEKPPPPGGCP